MSASAAYFDKKIAPRQSREKINEILEEDKCNIPRDLLPLLRNYMDSDSYGKLAILSLFNHDEHSKQDIMNRVFKERIRRGEIK